MRTQLESQADCIEGVLAQHGAPGRVTGGTVVPRRIRFKVLPATGAKMSKMKGLSEELAAALDAPSCRVARRGAAVVIEIPRDDVQAVRLMPLLEQLNGVPPMTAVLGLADDGAPLLIRLPSPDVAHILVAGTTGSGKTALLRTIVLSLALRHPNPKELTLVLLDPEGQGGLRCFDNLPHQPRLVDAGETAEALDSLVRLMDYRDGSPLVVVIDGLDSLAAEGRDSLAQLLQYGRETGIYVVAAARDWSNVSLRDGFPVRVVGRTAGAQDARAASGWPGTGAERLRGEGDFIAVAEGKLHRFTAAYISPEETAELVATIS